MANLFNTYHSPDNVQKVLVPRDAYHPFPKWGEDNGLPEDQKAGMIAAGEAYLDFDWPVPTAVAYTKFVTEGTRQPYEMKNYARRRTALVALMNAEYAEGKGRFIEDIINGMWAIMDEATWVVPAHNNFPTQGQKMLPDFDQPTIIDLFSAGTSAMLAVGYYLFKKPIDDFSPLVLRRLEIVLNERVFEPFMKNTYWWSGLLGGKTNNWDPWIISNVLPCYGMVCGDEAKRAIGIARCTLMLEQFLDVYDSDGGCDEGPSYWGAAGAALYDCLSELSTLTGGATDCFFDDPLVQNIGRYIYRAHIAGPYFTNYADAPRRFRTSAPLIYNYGKKIHDAEMQQFAVAVYNLYRSEDVGKPADFGGNPHHMYRSMECILTTPALARAENKGFPLLESVYLDGIQFVAERQKGGTTDGLYLSAKGGNNDESHNHNDVGTFIVYSDGQPAIVDIGSGQYNAKTFSAQRYEILQMQSSYHNLPEINGVMQHNGPQYGASDVGYRNKDGVTIFSENIAGAYPEQAGVATWQRTFIFDRTARNITIGDQVTFNGDKNTVTTMLVTPEEPVVQGNIVTVPAGKGRPVQVVCEGANSIEVEEVDLTYDPALTNNYNGHVWRVKVTAACGKNHTQRFTMTQK